jgi:hypothetical protein
MIDWDAVVGTPVTSVFGETVIYKDGAGVPNCFLGVFDSAYRPVMSLGDYADVSITTVMPVLGVQLSEMPCPPFQGMQLLIRCKTYSVKNVEEDGHGHAKLTLNLGSYER